MCLERNLKTSPKRKPVPTRAVDQRAKNCILLVTLSKSEVVYCLLHNYVCTGLTTHAESDGHVTKSVLTNKVIHENDFKIYSGYIQHAVVTQL
jgi:hypothetical protein